MQDFAAGHPFSRLPLQVLVQPLERVFLHLLGKTVGLIVEAVLIIRFRAGLGIDLLNLVTRFFHTLEGIKPVLRALQDQQRFGDESPQEIREVQVMRQTGEEMREGMRVGRKVAIHPTETPHWMRSSSAHR